MNWKLICQDVSYDEPMSRHTSFGIGGPADVFLRPRGREELVKILDNAPDALIIGNGTNLLISDAGIRGAVVTTLGMRTLEKIDDARISCECGALLTQVSAFAWKLGLSGFEFAAGIPGTVGGALNMNASAFDSEIARVVASSECLSPLGASTITEHGFGYRDSIYMRNNKLVALSAIISLIPEDSGNIRSKMDDFTIRRKSNQPQEWPSAGSIFKRPPGMYAGAIIEGCGLKGYSVGGAQVSEKHAGFIINRGGATCDDVLRLIDYIQRTVIEATGVSLELEVIAVGL